MNMKDLFTSESEFINFCNLKARKRIEELEKAKKEYQKDIEEALNKCDAIFEEYGNGDNIIRKLQNMVAREEIKEGE